MRFYKIIFLLFISVALRAQTTPVDWGSMYGNALKHDTLYNTGIYNWGQAVSKNTLAGNTDGWFEYVLKDVTDTKLIGFLDSISPNLQDFYDVDYGFYYSGENGYLYAIVQGGWTVVSFYPQEGSILRVERIGSTINLKLDTVIVSTIVNATDTQKSWKLKGSCFSTSTLINVGCSFYQQGNVLFPNYIRLVPAITHNSGASSNDGSISVKGLQTGTYAYTWQPGSIVSSSINSKPAGSYQVTVEDPLNHTSSSVYNIGYRADWGSMYGNALKHDTLYNTGIYNWGQAVSKNTLAGNTDGWFEYVLKDVTDTKLIGFLDSISPNLQDFYDVDYGFYYSGENGYLYAIVQGGWTIVSSYPQEGSILRVERIGSTINLKLNNVVVSTIVNVTDTQKGWKLKGFCFSTSTLINVGCSFYQQGNVLFPNYIRLVPTITHNSGVASNDGSISVKGLQTGTYVYTWQLGSIVSSSINSKPAGSYQVTVEDPLNHTSSCVYNIGYRTDWGFMYGSSLKHDTLYNTGIYSWGQAVSKNTLAGNTDGWFEYVFKDVTDSKLIGFLDSISPNLQDVSDVDYGFYYDGSNRYLYAIAQGGWTIVSFYPQEGSILRVERIGSTINLKLNNVIVSTLENATDARKNWKLKGACFSTSTLINVGCSFYQQGNVLFPNYIPVLPKVVHSSGIGLSDGSVRITPKQSGIYTYEWQPGSATSPSLLARPFGTYNLTVSDSINNQSSYSYNIGYKVFWNNVVGGYYRHDTIAEVNSACSKNTLLPNEDGWVEYIHDSLSEGSYVLGFSDSLAPIVNSVGDIDYGVYSYAGVYLYIYENSNQLFIGLSHVNDVIRIERIGDVINYKINNLLVRSITVPGVSQKAFKLKCNIDPSYMLVNVGCSFMHTDSIAFKNYVSVRPVIRNSTGPGISDGEIKVFPDMSSISAYHWSPGGAITFSIDSLPFGTYTVTVRDTTENSSPYEYHVNYKVKWDSIKGSGYFRNDTLAGTANTKSKNVLIPNQDGWMEYIQDNFVGDSYYIGFADTITPDYNFVEMDYGIYCYASTYIYTSESGNLIMIAGPKIGDIIRVERIGNTINYRINNAIVRTFTASDIAGKELKLMTSLGVGLKLVNVGCSFPIDPIDPVIPDSVFISRLNSAISYGILNKAIDGGFFNAKNGKVYFKFEEEYKGMAFNYKIYDYSSSQLGPGTPVNLMSCSSLNSLNTSLGDNRFFIDLLSCGSLVANKIYLLEATNSKNEKFYLKFIR